jgi:site-specific recombinase XerD
VSLRAQGKTAETIRVYLRSLGQYLDYAERAELPPMARRTLDAFLADLLDRGREGTTARSRLTAVRQFVRWLLREDELDVDPFAGVAPPRIDTKVIEPLGEDEIRAMLATCSSPKGAPKDRRFRDVRDEAVIRLMVETGLRASEVVGLQLEDVHWRDDPPYLIVRTAKSRRGRSVPFSAQASMAVDRYARLRRHHALHDSPALWLGARRNHLGYLGLYDTLTERAERAGIPRFHPHLLRHTAAHRWLAAGGSEGGLMSVAGWSRPDMLLRYTRARAEQRAAEEAKRLNLGEM